MEDRRLIKEIQQGHKELLNVVVEKYYKDIYGFCAYLSGNGEDAYDLAQETFLKFIRYVDNYQYRNLKGYLLTIARNVCMDYFRKEKNNAKNMTNIVDANPEEKDYLLTEGEAAFEQAEKRMWLRAQLQTLPAPQREAMVLYYYGELKIREIADIMSCSVPTAKSRIRQGTEKLRKRCKEAGYEG